MFFSDLKISLNRNLQEAISRKPNFGVTDSTLDIELSSDAKSVDDDDDDSAIGEGISESQPVSSARPMPPTLPPSIPTTSSPTKPVQKPTESTPASMRFNGMRSGFFPDAESAVRRIPIPGNSVVTAPVPSVSRAPPVEDGFKAMALHVSEVADSDDSERQSTSRVTPRRDASADDVDQQLLQRQQEEKEELERLKQEKV